MQSEDERGIRAFSVIMLVLINGATILINFENVSGHTATYPRPFGTTPHDPCRINSNAEFAASSCKTGGSGTSSDPYVIEGWDIDGTNQRYALYIGNTTPHFIVRNNRIHKASGVGTYPYYHNSGLILYNVSNGRIENNDILSNAWIGTFLVASENNKISNNTFDDNSLKGIYLDSSNNNEMRNNNVTNAGTGDGIHLSQSSNNKIISNYPNANSQRGIFLYFSDRNEIRGNDVFNNNDGGITLQLSNNNTMGDNHVFDNSGPGIFLDESNYRNNIFTNYICENFAAPNIALRMSNENIITGNKVCRGSTSGISLYGSNNNHINGNNVSDNWINGIRLNNSKNNQVISNLLLQNVDLGVYVTGGSTNNSIHHNDFLNNNIGRRQASDDSGKNRWNDTVIGNHWDDFDEPLEGCFDSDINGICDSPYNVISHENVSDHYPIVRITLPSAPINLVAKPGDKRVDLTWLPPERDGWSEITNYNVYRNGALLATIDDALNYTDTDLVNWVEYRYKISAINMAGEGKPSNEVSAVPFGIPPIIVNTSPRNGDINVAVDAKIVITFSRAMEHTSTYDSIVVNPSIQWKAKWSANDTVLTLTPSSNLQVDTNYNITLSTTASDINGTHMKSIYTFSFRTAQNYDMCMLAIAVLLVCGILLIYFILKRRRKTRFEKKKDEAKRIEPHEPKAPLPRTDDGQTKKRAIERIRRRRGRA